MSCHFKHKSMKTQYAFQKLPLTLSTNFIHGFIFLKVFRTDLFYQKLFIINKSSHFLSKNAYKLMYLFFHVDIYV